MDESRISIVCHTKHVPSGIIIYFHNYNKVDSFGIFYENVFKRGMNDNRGTIKHIDWK